MRWIATLVATCLVVVGASRGPRPERARDPHQRAIDDASALVAKLGSRRTAFAPDHRSERLQPYVAPTPPRVVTPARRAFTGSYATAPGRRVPTLVTRTSRGPPLGSSTGNVHLS